MPDAASDRPVPEPSVSERLAPEQPASEQPACERSNGPRSRPNGTWWSRWLPLLVLLGATLLIRTGAVAFLFDQLQADPDAYAHLARGLREQGVLGFTQADGTVRPTALRPPLYPLLLAPLVVDGQLGQAGVAALHVLLGVLTVLLVERLGRYWLERSVTGWPDVPRWPRYLAAGGVALDPLLLHQSALVMTETLAAALAAGGLLALTWLQRVPGAWRAGVAGVVLGLSILCRPSFAPWVAVSAALCLLVPSRFPRRLMVSGVCAAAAGLVLVPWAARNHQQLGRPILATTHGGYTLLLANNPHFYEHLRREAAGAWDARELHVGLRQAAHQATTFVANVPREIQSDQLDYRLARKAMSEDPTGFVRSSFDGVSRIWSPLPRQRSVDETTARRTLRYVTGAWYVLVYGLALAGLYHLGGRALRLPWLWGVALCVCFTLMHAFYWSDFRMRAPLLPVVYLFAAAGIARLTAVARRRRTVPRSALRHR